MVELFAAWLRSLFKFDNFDTLMELFAYFELPIIVGLQSDDRRWIFLPDEIVFFLSSLLNIHTRYRKTIVRLNSCMFCFGCQLKKMCMLISMIHIHMMIIFQVLQLGQFRAKAFVSLARSLANVNIDCKDLSMDGKELANPAGNTICSLFC